MSLLVLALIAGAALAHATWNIAIKRAGTTGASFLWVTFVIGAVVFLPFGIWSLGTSGADLTTWLPLALVSGAMQVGYFLLLQKGYSVGDVSVVYPLARGSGPLLTVVFAIIVFGERPSPPALLGAAIVISGVIVIGLAGDRSHRVDARPGIIYGLIIGIVIAAFTLWDSAAVTTWGMPVIGLYWGSVLTQALLVAPVALRDRAAIASAVRSHWPAALIVGILGPLAYMLVLLAIQLAPVSVVAPAREVSVVLVGLAGWLLFREPHPIQRLVGAGIVLAGIGFLAAG